MEVNGVTFLYVLPQGTTIELTTEVQHTLPTVNESNRGAPAAAFS